jgi:hypothetical protein
MSLPAGDEIGRRSMMLKCNLTVEEIDELQGELVEWTRNKADLELKLEAWNAARKDEKKLYEAEIMAAGGKLLRIANTIKDGFEQREVGVVDTIHASTVSTVRLDTEQIIAERPATKDELQRELPLEDRVLPEEAQEPITDKSLARSATIALVAGAPGETDSEGRDVIEKDPATGKPVVVRKKRTPASAAAEIEAAEVREPGDE